MLSINDAHIFDREKLYDTGGNELDWAEKAYYNMPKLDGEGNLVGPGVYGTKTYSKIIYNPELISDFEFFSRGMEAADDALSREMAGILPYEWSGMDSKGVKWLGYFKNGKITFFFPVVEFAPTHMKNLILDAELKDKTHTTIQKALSHFYNTNDFKKVLHYLSKKTGYGDSHVGFTFWSDLDDYNRTFFDEKFDGIGVDYIDDRMIIDYESFYYYLDVACRRYLTFHPEDQGEIEDLLAKIKDALASG